MCREPVEAPEPFTLLDVGFQVLPEYCPKPLLHSNLQSEVLVVFYVYMLLWVARNWRSGRGEVMLIRFFLMNSLVFVTRTSVVGLTSLPQPNFAKHCSEAQIVSLTYWEALWEVCRNFPPKACGDLIYSGHVACAFTSLFIFDSLQAYPQNPPGWDLPQYSSRLIFYVLGFIAVFSCLLCRSHYTVDVVLGLYFAYFLSDFYLQRAEGVVVGGCLGEVIRLLEGWQKPSIALPIGFKSISNSEEILDGYQSPSNESNVLCTEMLDEELSGCECSCLRRSFPSPDSVCISCDHYHAGDDSVGIIRSYGATSMTQISCESVEKSRDDNCSRNVAACGGSNNWRERESLLNSA